MVFLKIPEICLDVKDENGSLSESYYYNYASGNNQLINVDNSGTDFDYDLDGRLIADDTRNVTDIIYSYNNLPIQICIDAPDDPVTIRYGYNDAANRLFKKIDDWTETVYIRGADGQVMAEYDGYGDLKMWRMGGFGYKTKSGSTTTSYYYLKDHIGNIRVTVNQNVSVVTKDDYYPFGLQMPGLSYSSASYDYLKFSGKELDEEEGLYKYHFGWRDYDPTISRWFVVDPARQYVSPYVFGGNNPINTFDQDGRFSWGLFMASVIWNAAFSGANEMNHGGDFWSWEGAGRGAAIGAISNAGGQFAATPFGLTSPTGALPGAGYGAATQGVIGGITSEISGGTFANGFYSNAIIGAVTGGISGYERSAALGENPWTGGKLPSKPLHISELIAIDESGFNRPKIELSKSSFRSPNDFNDPLTWAEAFSESGKITWDMMDCTDFLYTCQRFAGTYSGRRYTTLSLMQAATEGKYRTSYGISTIVPDILQNRDIINMRYASRSMKNINIYKYKIVGHAMMWDASKGGLWHSSSGMGPHFTPYGSSEWRRLMTTFGLPNILR